MLFESVAGLQPPARVGPVSPVRRACSDGADEPGVGVRALCVDRNGTAMETEYVSFNPPRAVAIKMTRGPWFLESFAGSWRFEEVKPGQTRVGFYYSLGRTPARGCRGC